MSKDKLERAFGAVAERGEKAFVSYIMAGDGGLDRLEEKILFLQEAGVTAIELGIPFSDPVADGPTVQKAGLRALEHDVSLKDIIGFLSEQEFDVPIVFMTYFNLIYRYGVEAFCRDAARAKVSGVIIPDLPLEQSRIIAPHLKENNIAFIQLVSLTSPEERIAKIAAASEGFLYAVTVNGITGERDSLTEELTSYLSKIKQYSNIPVLAGFGISNPEQVRLIGSMCDGVIVGSKIINLLEAERFSEIKELISAGK